MIRMLGEHGSFSELDRSFSEPERSFSELNRCFSELAKGLLLNSVRLCHARLV